MSSELKGLKCCLSKPKKKSTRSQLLTPQVLKFLWGFPITTVLQRCILHSLNHAFGLRLGGGIHVSVTMSILPGISYGLLTEDIWCQRPCQTRWSFHYVSQISFRTRDGNTWELLITCWRKSNEEECTSAASILYLKQICLWPHSQNILGGFETYGKLIGIQAITAIHFPTLF